MPAEMDDWYGYVWSVPKDEDFAFTTTAAYPGESILYGIVQRLSDGKVWNAGAEEPAFEVAADGNWASSAIPFTKDTPTLYSFTVPWSAIGTGTFVLRAYEQAGGTPQATDKQIHLKHYDITSKQVPRTDGISMTSQYGGIDTYRVTDAEDHGLEAVEVYAYKIVGDVKWVRGHATTDRLGRWAMKTPLQPSTTHTLEFTKPGFQTRTLTVTTGPLT